MQSASKSQTTNKSIATYFQQNEKGWFWYEALPKETQIKIQQAVKNILTNEQPQALSPAWYRKNFQKYMDKAQANPYDKESMRTYLYLEKYVFFLFQTR